MLGALGCTDLAPVSDTCAQVEGCLPPPEPPPVLPSNWKCIEDGPPEKGPPPDLISLVVFVIDFANAALVPDGLSVQVCYQNDFDCGRPWSDPRYSPDSEANIGIVLPASPELRAGLSQRGLPAYLVDGARQILLPANGSFQGFLRVGAAGYTTLDYHLLSELQYNLEEVMEVQTEEGVVRIATLLVDPIPLAREGSVDGFFRAVGQERDESKGITLVRNHDCEGVRAAGVSVETDVPGLRWAFIDGRPLARDGILSDAQGVVGYANQNAEGVTLDARIPVRPDETFADTNIVIQPNIVSMIDLRPPNSVDRQLNLTIPPDL